MNHPLNSQGYQPHLHVNNRFLIDISMDIIYNEVKTQKRHPSIWTWYNREKRQNTIAHPSQSTKAAFLTSSEEHTTHTAPASAAAKPPPAQHNNSQPHHPPPAPAGSAQAPGYPSTSSQHTHLDHTSSAQTYGPQSASAQRRADTSAAVRSTVLAPEREMCR